MHRIPQTPVPITIARQLNPRTPSSQHALQVTSPADEVETQAKGTDDLESEILNPKPSVISPKLLNLQGPYSMLLSLKRIPTTYEIEVYPLIQGFCWRLRDSRK